MYGLCRSLNGPLFYCIFNKLACVSDVSQSVSVNAPAEITLHHFHNEKSLSFTPNLFSLPM